MNNPSQITKEQAEAVFDLRAGYQLGNTDIDILRKLAGYALAVMDAEPVASCTVEDGQMCPDGFGECAHSLPDGTYELYTVPPAPIVPDEKPMPNPLSMYAVDAVAAIAEVEGWNACRAAMLQSFGNSEQLEPVSQPYKLPSQSSDAVNEAAWKLHDTLTEHGPLNAHQFNNLKGCFYEALKVAMCNSPVIPDGFALVPIVPTEEMIIEGFESEPDESFSAPEVWEAYDAMSGCQQAAHRAKLCWAAMLAAAPNQETK